MEMKGIRRRIRMKLHVGLRKRRTYWKLKEKTEDRKKRELQLIT